MKAQNQYLKMINYFFVQGISRRKMERAYQQVLRTSLPGLYILYFESGDLCNYMGVT
jgi:hypothetical protein